MQSLKLDIQEYWINGATHLSSIIKKFMRKTINVWIKKKTE